jgi:hypothetical protein
MCLQKLVVKEMILAKEMGKIVVYVPSNGVLLVSPYRSAVIALSSPD